MSASHRPKTATLALTLSQEYQSPVGSPIDGDKRDGTVVNSGGKKDEYQSYS